MEPHQNISGPPIDKRRLAEEDEDHEDVIEMESKNDENSPHYCTYCNQLRPCPFAVSKGLE